MEYFTEEKVFKKCPPIDFADLRNSGSGHVPIESKKFRKRARIEPIIGHQKSDHMMT